MNYELTLLIVFIGILLGSMLFFAISIAPTVFRSLPEDQAGRFLRALFPQYYLWGIVITGITALVSLLTDFMLSIAFCIIAVLFIYARQILMPQINRARDDELQGMAGAGIMFKRLHLRSVMINALQLLALVGIVVYMIVP